MSNNFNSGNLIKIPSRGKLELEISKILSKHIGHCWYTANKLDNNDMVKDLEHKYLEILNDPKEEILQIEKDGIIQIIYTQLLFTEHKRNFKIDTQYLDNLVDVYNSTT